VAFVAFIANEISTVSTMMEKDLETQAEVIAQNCGGALVAQDSSTAMEMLHTLQFKANIINAYILTKDNLVLAAYQSSHHLQSPRRVAKHPEPPGETAIGSVLGDETLAQLLRDYPGVHRIVGVGGKVVGSVVLISDESPVVQRLSIYIRNAMLIILLALAIAYLLSTRLTDRISRPVLDLASAMTKVNRDEDYSLRASKSSNDEVGTLIDQFNAMLERIEERDELLRQRGEHLEQLAHFDALTGLPNRLLIIDRLGQALTHAAANNEKIAVLFIDLDHFKDINDTLGHRIGDQLLKEVGIRLRSSIRGTDNVGRLGGDEFVVFVTESKVIENVVIMIQRLIEGFATPFVIEDTEIFVTASIGATFYPMDGDSVEALLSNADITGSSPPTCNSGQACASRCTTGCGVPSTTVNLSCFTNRPLTSPAGRPAVSRHCCAGTARRRESSLPCTLSRWPRKPG
jgi:diguanylate cyclase (GGDEF)-like protein